jgi:hypothetical protein
MRQSIVGQDEILRGDWKLLENRRLSRLPIGRQLNKPPPSGTSLTLPAQEQPGQHEPAGHE